MFYNICRYFSFKRARYHISRQYDANDPQNAGLVQVSVLEGGDGADSGWSATCGQNNLRQRHRFRTVQRGGGKLRSALDRVVKYFDVQDMIPTVGFNMRKITKGNVTIKLWDIGGQPRFRSMWERYCRGVNAIVYMVDAADPDKIEVKGGGLLSW